MKAIYSKIICTLALLFVLTGCVQNNGNIGPWFGQWKVERLTIDGKDDPDYAGNAFFRFQASVFSVCISYPDEHTSGTYYGTWTENGDYVDVVFNTKESAVPKQCAWIITANAGWMSESSGFSTHTARACCQMTGVWCRT